MNNKYTSPLVIFPEDAFQKMTSKIDDFDRWELLQTLYKRNDFKEDADDAILMYYKPDSTTDEFLDLQLKFFLVRNSHNRASNIRTTVTDWMTITKNQFPQYNSKLITIQLLTFGNENLKRYGKYYYNVDAYKAYVSQWNNGTVELNTWKRFSLLLMPQNFQFMAPLFKEEGGLKFPVPHMRKLFDEYVDELYIQKLKPRMNSKILADRDRIIIDRVIQNIGSKEDKIYLKKQFLNFYSWRIISENISKALANEISISELDINSQAHFANYFALVKYYQALTEKPEKKKEDKISTFSEPKKADYRIEINCTDKENATKHLLCLFNGLKKINMVSMDTTDDDIKSVFSGQTTDSIILWKGANSLTYLIKQIDNVYQLITVNGRKWEVISKYFKNKSSDIDFLPSNLQHNTSFTNTNEIDKLIKEFRSNLQSTTN